MDRRRDLFQWRLQDKSFKVTDGRNCEREHYLTSALSINFLPYNNRPIVCICSTGCTIVKITPNSFSVTFRQPINPCAPTHSLVSSRRRWIRTRCRWRWLGRSVDHLAGIQKWLHWSMRFDQENETTSFRRPGNLFASSTRRPFFSIIVTKLARGRSQSVQVPSFFSTEYAWYFSRTRKRRSAMLLNLTAFESTESCKFTKWRKEVNNNYFTFLSLDIYDFVSHWALHTFQNSFIVFVMTIKTRQPSGPEAV